MKKINQFYLDLYQDLSKHIKKELSKYNPTFAIETSKNTSFPFILFLEKNNVIHSENLSFQEQKRILTYDIEIYSTDIMVGNQPRNKTLIVHEIASIIAEYLEYNRFNVFMNATIPNEDKNISRKLIRFSVVYDVETNTKYRK